MKKLDGLCDGVGDDGTGVTKEDYLYGLLVEHPEESFHAVTCIALGVVPHQIEPVLGEKGTLVDVLKSELYGGQHTSARGPLHLVTTGGEEARYIQRLLAAPRGAQGAFLLPVLLA